MEFLDLGRESISEKNPAGIDVQYEPEYESLQDEIEKLSSVGLVATIDWDKIIDLSTLILSEKSKNLLVASYLNFALFKKEDLKGLSKGTHIINDMLQNFWDTLYPGKKRMRGRENAINWWYDKIDSSLSGILPEKWEENEKEAFINELISIDNFLTNNMENTPVLTGLITRISNLLTTETEQKKPLSPSAASKSGIETEQDSQDQVSELDADKFLKKGLDILGRIASEYFKKEDINSLTYKLDRIVAWFQVKDIPPNVDGKTMLPPPDEETIALLNRLYSSKNWKELLKTAESYVRQYLFWLDLSFYVTESLKQLGYEIISQMVVLDTLEYVKRLQGIEKLQFADGSHFANEETRSWLKSSGKKRSDQDILLDVSTKEGAKKNEMAKEFKKADSLIKNGKIAKALTDFKQKMDQAGSGKNKFLWQIGFCKLLFNTKNIRLTTPYIQELMGTIDKHLISEWEPELALTAYITILSGLRKQKTESNKELIDKLINRISSLDPVKALEIL